MLLWPPSADGKRPCPYRVERAAGADSGCAPGCGRNRSEEHTSELQSRENLVCRLLLSSPLFPYTTLFRSAGCAALGEDRVKIDVAADFWRQHAAVYGDECFCGHLQQTVSVHVRIG